MSIPKVFVSYSHDSQPHKKWVLDLATRMRNIGVDATLDQWDLGPGDDVPIFMEKSLAGANRVVLVCTERYVEKANAGSGGVGYERMIITAELMKRIDSNKIIPIIRQSGPHLLPVFLGSKFYLDFSRADQYEESFDELARSVHNAPLFVKPAISMSPFVPVADTAVRSGDGLLEMMTHLIEVFELMRDDGYVSYRALADRWPGSRTMLDILLEDAQAAGLITRAIPAYIEITRKGKMYALDKKLIK